MKGRTILFVDDEQEICEVISSYFTNFGFNVLTAFDGPEAIELFSNNKDTIDIVVLDLTLPHLGGKAVLHEMLQIQPNIKVLISSGFEKHEIEESILQKASGFIGKPFAFDQCLNQIRRML